MHRIRLDALQEQGGRLYHQGEPFTGMAYEIRGDRVPANYRVVDGVRNGPGEDWDPARPRVLFRAITIFPDEPSEQFPEQAAYLDGIRFDGLAYVFDKDTGRLLEEQDFDEGLPGSSREWFSSGVLAFDSDRVRPDGLRESVTYFESGQIHSVMSQRMSWGITPEGRLRSLILWHGYLEGDLRRVPRRIDAELFLAGEGITDEILGRMEDWPNVADLELSNTGISARGLERLRVCSNLKKLITRGNAGFGEADVRDLLTHLPGCKWHPHPR